MNDQKNPDYLSRLPPELLDDIFELAYDYNTRQTTPLSKHLLPSQERTLFLTLYARSYNALERLCTVSQRRPEALANSRLLRFEIKRESGAKGMVEQVQTSGTPSDEQIKLLFNKVSNIRSLCISGSSQIARLVMDPAVAEPSFPNLSSLELASTFRDIGNPFHLTNLASLQLYTKLRWLDLDVWRIPKSIQLVDEPLPTILPFLSKVDRVSLRGPLSISSQAVKSLLSSLGSLSAVSLVDRSKKSRIYSLLEGLTKPEELRNLELIIRHSQGKKPYTTGLESPKNLTSLKYLSFGGLASPPDYTSFHNLPLVCLTFKEEAKVSLSRLTQLVTGDAKIKPLENIELWNVQGAPGTRIEDMGEPYYDRETGGLDIYPNWILPEWTDDFDEDGLVDFIELAEREGIKVDGTAVWAIGVDEEYEDELETLEAYEEEEEIYECG